MSLAAVFRGDAVGERYKLGRQLGAGSFAAVRQATCIDDGGVRAVKMVKRAHMRPAAALRRNIAALKDLAALRHANIVLLRECFEDAKLVYIVMELCDGGEVFDRISEREQYTEADARAAVRQVAVALEACHSHGLAHRDLKPENLLYASMDSEVIKLADVGLASMLTPNTALAAACGSPGYVAPEVLTARSCSKEVDLWALGVVAFILLCGSPPFHREHFVGLFDDIKKGDFEFPSPDWDRVSDGSKDLVRRLLVVDPAGRYSAGDVLRHAWVNDADRGGADLVHFPHNLRRYNARRKFKASVTTLQAVAYLGKQGAVSAWPAAMPTLSSMESPKETEFDFQAEAKDAATDDAPSSKYAGAPAPASPPRAVTPIPRTVSSPAVLDLATLASAADETRRADAISRAAPKIDD
ncbi:kinase-like domain-containing protein [Pelagophyceae sp. CCMP2097]|nr:kinase-like domain-containing protein [Pelagophyceae sp. CCMP2097]